MNPNLSSPTPLTPPTTSPTPTDSPLIGFPPVISANARLMVLGSFPGNASLQQQRYYGHPRNQFWPLLSALWGEDLVAMDYPTRLDVVRARGLAIWDVYAQCRREGSLDANIQAPQRQDFSRLRDWAPSLQALAFNGGEAARSQKVLAQQGWAVHRLPSSSPANASWSFERKLAVWHEVFARYDLAA